MFIQDRKPSPGDFSRNGNATICFIHMQNTHHQRFSTGVYEIFLFPLDSFNLLF